MVRIIPGATTGSSGVTTGVSDPDLEIPTLPWNGIFPASPAMVTGTGSLSVLTTVTGTLRAAARELPHSANNINKLVKNLCILSIFTSSQIGITYISNANCRTASISDVAEHLIIIFRAIVTGMPEKSFIDSEQTPNALMSHGLKFQPPVNGDGFIFHIFQPSHGELERENKSVPIFSLYLK